MAGLRKDRGLRMCIGVFVVGVHEDKSLFLTLNGNLSKKKSLIEDKI